jgi:hypothetical protein
VNTAALEAPESVQQSNIEYGKTAFKKMPAIVHKDSTHIDINDESKQNLSRKAETSFGYSSSGGHYLSRQIRLENDLNSDSIQYHVPTLVEDHELEHVHVPYVDMNRLELIEEEDSAVLRQFSEDFSANQAGGAKPKFGENTNQSIGYSLEKYNRDFSSVERHLNIVREV